jgi:hypothetical protein
LMSTDCGRHKSTTTSFRNPKGYFKSFLGVSPELVGTARSARRDLGLLDAGASPPILNLGQTASSGMTFVDNKKADESGHSGARWTQDGCFFDVCALLTRLFSFYFEREDFPQLEAIHSREEIWKCRRDQIQRCTGKTRCCFLGQIAHFRNS